MLYQFIRLPTDHRPTTARSAAKKLTLAKIKNWGRPAFGRKISISVARSQHFSLYFGAASGLQI